MRAGRSIRQAQRLDAADARPCPECGHPTGDHRELPYGTPEYQAAVFHCEHDGCSCVLVSIDVTGAKC